MEAARPVLSCILKTEGHHMNLPPVIMDPGMKSSRNMESTNGEEVVPPSLQLVVSSQTTNNPKPSYANITKSKPSYVNITKSQGSSNHTALFWETMKPVLQHKIPYWNDRETMLS